MSFTTVGVNAPDVTLRLVGPGEDDEVPAGHVDLVITDHASMIEVHVVGTPQTLRSLVWDGLSLPIPAGVPLVDEDPGVLQERAARAERGTEGWEDGL
jgi:hypothetical protein